MVRAVSSLNEASGFKLPGWDSVQFVFSPTIQMYACDLNEMMLIDTVNVMLIGDYRWGFKGEWFSVSVLAYNTRESFAG